VNNDVKLIFFNVDGTLVDGMEYIYQHLWEYFGIDKQKTRDVLKQYLSKEIDYSSWVKNDVRLLQEAGATRRGILDAIMSLHPMEGAIGTIRALQERGNKIFAISGGIDLVVESVYGEEYKKLFQEVFINQYKFDADEKLIGVTPPKYDVDHKADCVKDMMQTYGADPRNCIYIGNNENDASACLLVGTSIAFNSKSERLVEVTTHHIESKDLFDILKFLG
jgi:HAD superfamily phosphoserine phosphatase-like hydrolase